MTTGVCTGTKSGCEGGGDGPRPARGVLGELRRLGQLGYLRQLGQFRQLFECLGGVEVHGLQAREVGLARQEERRVLADPGETAQQGRGVGGVARLLGGPEGTGLGELALTLLGECFGHSGAYFGGGGSRGAALRRHRGGTGVARGQFDA